MRQLGYGRLAKRHRELSLEETRDTEELIDRILYLEGLPNLQRLGTLRVGETPVAQIRLAAADLERTAVATSTATSPPAWSSATRAPASSRPG